MRVIREASEYTDEAIHFHQVVANILGVNATDMKCLDLLVLNGSASPTQLAAYTGLSTGATTAMIDRLEKAGLIERHPHPKDRRGTIVMLTKEASFKLRKLFESLATRMNALVTGYSERELSMLTNFFSKTSELWRSELGKLLASSPIDRE